MGIPAKTHTRPVGRAAVLDLLKREGPVSVASLAARLGVTAMAVRQHLAGLEANGLAAPAPAEPKAKSRGRPLTLWRATEAADAHFPDSHSLLAVDLLGQMKKTFGDDGLDRLLALRTADQERAYGAELARAKSLKGRLDALVRIREREGYMPELRRDARSGSYLFVENHCPICSAARLCQGLCREELALFRRVLGEDVHVERTDHILAGAGRCAYRVAAV
jgi:predicted ArsR family transcriptional regulator